MSRKRVYFFNRFYWPDGSATAQILTDLCHGLEKTDLALTVVCSRLDYNDPKKVYPAEQEHDGIQIRRLWSTRFGRGNVLGRFLDYLTVYIGIFIFMLQHLRPGDIAVFKTDPPLLSVLGTIGKYVKGCATVSWCQDIFPEVALSEMQLPWPMRRFFEFLVIIRDWSLVHSDQVVVLGEDMERYVSRHGVDRSRISVISNWSVQGDKPAGRAGFFREQWDIPEEAFVVGYSGNLGRAHDWETVLEVARRIEASRPVIFLCCGGGAHYKRLQTAVEEGQLEDRFRFLPYQDLEDLADTLQVPDVHWLSLKNSLTPFIFPSKFFGILQASRPLVFIGDPRSAIAGLIEGHGAGVAIAPGDAGRFTAYVERLVKDSEEAEIMGKHAYALWQSHFQKSQEIHKWERLFQKLGVAWI